MGQIYKYASKIDPKENMNIKNTLWNNEYPPPPKKKLFIKISYILLI